MISPCILWTKLIIYHEPHNQISMIGLTGGDATNN